ncbi:alkaline phosphatase D family protein [Glaciecola petra]|uniref:Alkaline phosphatase D family protein n=1 Tax=Glaciecola petra TaxID=3075602 RepID=A0ABU2ZY81_9ALTE|nr:alkaline phosphatase D family protein [Aestuariibacter sp. P117]MDT0596539.1 alkaline phosphatase D family protein [Aestuariibacter sp. P117]
MSGRNNQRGDLKSYMTNNALNLPKVLAGPIVRHINENTFTLWLVTSASTRFTLLMSDKKDSKNEQLPFDELHNIVDNSKLTQTETPVGERCFIQHISLSQEALLEDQKLYYYDLQLTLKDQSKTVLSKECPELLYQGENRFSFKYSQTLKQVIHGSCRKAHYEGQDALPQLDTLLENSVSKAQANERPDLVLFTGDQVYIDDVAGPMLTAIKQVIDILGLYHEEFTGSTIKDSAELFAHKDSYYKREQLLPDNKSNDDLSDAFFKSKKKPVFTSVNALNHLIALNEMLALYLLSWSSRIWPFVHISKDDINKYQIPSEYSAKYEHEIKLIADFKAGIGQVERAFAHVPIYMIFDDHDVTDDWNLTRGWEEQIYGNPFSKRIIGNALCAYLLCQGIGNPKYTWENLQNELNNTFTNEGIYEHDSLIDRLLEHKHWHYGLKTYPPIQVLDTRTQRWRSESNKNKPSGLMDWEALCELQQQIIGKESVIMVSAAPVYGVKLIEAIQKVFTVFGGALMVDAENWMAHKGTASVMLNIFRHIKTPPNFIILSGDVHYSFVYDVSLRFRQNSPKVVQFTCSGIHNEFPDKLIRRFERANKWLYGHRSPLNWLTKRRNMSIKERESSVDKRDIVNASSLGLLILTDQGTEEACKLILADGSQVTFEKA